MSHCPKCGASVTADFGMVVCPQCSAVIFFDVDGHPQVGGHSEEDKLSIELESKTLSHESLTTDLASDNPEYEKSLSSQSEIEQNISSFTETEGELTDSNLDNNSSVSDNGSMLMSDSTYAAQDVDGTQAVSYENSNIVEDQGVLNSDELKEENYNASKSIDFDFNEESLNDAISVDPDVSGLTYDLHISGIDTSDLQRKVFDEISDSKLGLDLDILKTKLKLGELTLSKISAVKTAVIVRRLRFSKLHLKWRQNV